ncbi:MAG TPA: LCP family protein [Candidatus Limnocylindrales bacterium]|nr:LCP family protein [Candidatus Limnocylindrales bacterium]
MDGGRSPGLAALLSFLLPGLGQLYAGRPRRALLFLVPALLTWGVILAALAGGWWALFGLLVRPAVLNVLLLVNVVLLLLHGLAVVDAYALTRRRAGHGGRRGGAGFAALLLALAGTLLVHGLPGMYGYSLAVNLPRFVNDGPSSGMPTPSWAVSPSAEPTHAPTDQPSIPASPSPTLPPTPDPSPSGTPFSGPPWADDGRLNVLLLGSDAGPGRWSARPDAVHLVSIEIETGRAALFAFPRYMNNLPMPPETAHMFKDGRYPGYLNSLYVAALNNPRRYPYNDDAGWGVMAGVVQELSGVELDGYMVVDLHGFERMVDALGGLHVQVPPPGVVDPRYGLGTGRTVRLRLDPGCHQLDGRMTLFFSRSRRQDGDIQRLGRQLVTLRSVLRQHDPLEVLPRLPAIFDAAGDGFHTSFGSDDLAPLAEVLGRVDPDRVHTTIFAAPEYPRDLRDDTVERIHEVVRGVFDRPRAPAQRVDCPPD